MDGAFRAIGVPTHHLVLERGTSVLKYPHYKVRMKSEPAAPTNMQLPGRNGTAPVSSSSGATACASYELPACIHSPAEEGSFAMQLEMKIARRKLLPEVHQWCCSAIYGPILHVPAKDENRWIHQKEHGY